jgi:hypothetical protein
MPLNIRCWSAQKETFLLSPNRAPAAFANTNKKGGRRGARPGQKDHPAISARW